MSTPSERPGRAAVGDQTPETVGDLSVDASLPIAAHAEEITALLACHQVVIVAGETGSGKTTQLPKLLLAMGRRSIAHTQPRRIAARSVATRIAEELGVPLGGQVGYQVRFTRQTSRSTRLTVMTDGILLAEIGHDRDLRRYDTIIIDEAHERSLNIDFLIGFLTQLLPRRPDLLVVITSATIDTERFSAHFGGAPVVRVSGRSYPVELRYRPMDAEADQPEAIVAAAKELMAAGPGDILVFLAGEREIRDTEEALAGVLDPAAVQVLPLYARLSLAEQHRVFTAHPGRRIVLATNVAETSLTVPGIRSVIDPGTARISRYSVRTKVQRLPIEAVSRASADQRAGRCGRVGPGICVRLYSEQDYLSRPEFTEPEILRTNLAQVILQMAQAGLGDITRFPFLEAPDPAQINDGLRLLVELGAITSASRSRPRLTRTGRALAQLPIDPRLGRMVLAGAERDCLREVLVLTAGLAIPDVRERPAEHRAQADAAHARFINDETLRQAGQAPPGPAAPGPGAQAPARYTVHTGRKGFAEQQASPVPDQGGDFSAMLRLWRYLVDLQSELSSSQFRRRCRQEYLNHLRVREWQDLHTQLAAVCRELGLHRNARPAPVEDVLTAMLTGLLSQIGLAEVVPPAGRTPGVRRTRSGPREYLGARGARFAINPGSVLARHPPELVMAVELVETTRLWARTVAGIRAEWVEQVAGHLLKRQHSEPHWSSTAGAVLARERVTLYGVPIIADRLVDYARVNPLEARRIFIQSGLVEGEWTPPKGSRAGQLTEHNRQVRAELAELEERTRRRDLALPDQVVADFFEARLPEQVVSAAGLERWLREAEPGLLELSLADLLDPAGSGPGLGQFPDTWRLGELELPVEYTFDPGSGADGVLVTIPLAQLNQVPAEPFSWQVPGLRAELATALIRSLPKALRTQLVPAPDRAREALRWLAEHEADPQAWFPAELGRALHALTGAQIGTEQWRPAELPEHLRVAFRVDCGQGRLETGRDLAELRTRLAPSLRRTLNQAARRRPVSGTSWVFGTIPVSREVSSAGLRAVGYPALADRGSTVELVMLDDAALARRQHLRGISRLLALVTPDPTRWTIAHLGNAEKLALGTSPYPRVPDLLADARLKAIGQLAAELGRPAEIRDQAAFTALAEAVRQQQAERMAAVVGTTARVLIELVEARRLLDGPALPGATRADVAAQLDNLVFEGFITFTRDPWFDQLPRYLQAVNHRLQRAGVDPGRELDHLAVITQISAEYAALVDRQPAGPLSDEVDDLGFWLEELRVQLFAQHLRTHLPVSVQRIRRAISAIG